MDPTIQNISHQTEVPVSSVESPPRGKQFHRSKKFSALIIFLFIIIVIGAFFSGRYYQGMSRKKEVVQASSSPVLNTPSVTNTQAAQWKTYENSSNHYSLKYPPDWELNPRKDYPVSETDQSFTPIGQSETLDIGLKQIIIRSYIDSDSFRKDYNNKDPKSFFDGLYAEKAKTPEEKYGKIKNTTVDGIPAVLLTSCYELEPTVNTIVYAYKAPYLYTITAWEYGQCKVGADFEKIFNQTLKTFIVTNINDSSDVRNWKEFSGDRYSLKLPADWTFSKTTGGDIYQLKSTREISLLIVPITDQSENELKKSVLGLFSGSPATKSLTLGTASATEYYGCAGLEGCINQYIVVANDNGILYKIDFVVSGTINVNDKTLYQTIISSLHFQ